MMLNDTTIQMFRPFMRLLEELAGEKSEILICRLTTENVFEVVERQGNIHSYVVGDSLTSITPELLEECNDLYRTCSGLRGDRSFRSIVMSIHDECKISGCIVVNFDVSDLIYLQRYLSGITGIGQPLYPERYDDISQLLDNMLEKAWNEIGKPVSSMKKKDKRAFIKYLDDRGYFQIKKSTEKVMNFLDISKFTLYAHLEEIRSAGQSSLVVGNKKLQEDETP